MCRIAARSRRLPALGIDPLNAGRARKHAAALVAHNIHQQPRNRIRIRRRHIGYRFARNAAAVARLPRRPREMFSERFSILVKQLRIRCFQRPRSRRRVALARLELQKLLARRRLNLWRRLLPVSRERKNHARDGEQRSDCSPT